jgi:hypothetical protein
VFETALDGLAAVPRRQRYLPMLAGLLADTVNVSLLTIVALLLLGPGDRMTLGSGVCLALAYTTLLRMLWQAYFHLETDLYYVIATVCGCVNLRQTAREMLRNRVNRLLGRAGEAGPPGPAPLVRARAGGGGNRAVDRELPGGLQPHRRGGIRRRPATVRGDAPGADVRGRISRPGRGSGGMTWPC